MAEYIRKCRIYGNGCMKHGRTVEAQKYLKKRTKMQEELENY